MDRTIIYNLIEGQIEGTPEPIIVLGEAQDEGGEYAMDEDGNYESDE